MSVDLIDGVGLGIILSVLAHLFWMLIRFRPARHARGKDDGGRR